MSNNVIILGAGASFDAGIPLMNGFVDKMWEFAIRGRNGLTNICDEDRKVFEKAEQIRRELDSYHGRAAFDDRNLEDILSILSFNVLAGNESDVRKLSIVIRAISRTIEHTCTVKHDGVLEHHEAARIDRYQEFWHALFKWYDESGDLPTIISFNYDLVLERSLLRHLVGPFYKDGERPVPFEGIRICYHYDPFPPPAFRVKYVRQLPPDRFCGTALEPCKASDLNGKVLLVEILKLHGSLNFPHVKAPEADSGLSLARPVPDPFILPPIFNKLATNEPVKMWRKALERLRSAKNIVIVGYSLPRTDIYMQYFLKTALGPNLDLNRLFVFNPDLFKEGTASVGMKDRYACCFSSQLQDRIEFQPARHLRATMPGGMGTFEHFVATISGQPRHIFFMP